MSHGTRSKIGISCGDQDQTKGLEGQLSRKSHGSCSLYLARPGYAVPASLMDHVCLTNIRDTGQPYQSPS